MEDSQLIMIIEGVLLVAGRTLDINQIEKIFDKETSSLDNQSLEKIYKIESGNSIISSGSINKSNT